MTIGYEEFLINGYKIYNVHTNEHDERDVHTSERDEPETTRVQVMIKAGVYSENIPGLSHLLEHILLDSWELCYEDCIKYWKDKGISFNAYTGSILVSYFIYGLSKFTQEMIQFLTSIITNPKITQFILDKCKKAVKQELLNYINNPSWVINNTLYSTVFTEGPLKNLSNYSLQLESLDKITLEDVYSFYNKWYTSDNMVFVVSNQTNFLDEFSRSPWILVKRNSNVPRKIFTNTYNDNKMIYIHRKDSKKTVFSVTFVSDNNGIPFIRKDDIKYLNIFKDILTGDLTSYLYNILRVELGLIYEISLNFEITFDGILSMFSFSTENNKAYLLINKFLEMMKLFLEGNFSDALFQKTKDRMILFGEESCKNTDYYCSYYASEFIYEVSEKVPPPMKYIENNNTISKSEFITLSKKLIDFNKYLIIYESSQKLK
jgi:predicted Zn-dependent peptidase